MSHSLLDGWVALAGSSRAAGAVGAELVARWAEPHRRYHTLDHLRAVLDAIDRLAPVADDPDAVRLAAWFHDAVYDGKAGSDEERSAQLAQSRLARCGVPGERVAEVARLVRLTATHDPDYTPDPPGPAAPGWDEPAPGEPGLGAPAPGAPGSNGPASDRLEPDRLEPDRPESDRPESDGRGSDRPESDGRGSDRLGSGPAAGRDANGAVLCDADLAVLGGDDYAGYAAAVRQEYAHVPDELFRLGRAQVLRRLLAAPRLYRTALGHDLWEARARASLTAELATLDS
ncbi:hypothetical protein ACFXJ8_38250 [Nonomuraea sp. NPDC059194]|uniref:HD domain-containing protein n=1 Tax=Nonomuraea sp. NPDC059194 TaxID=3346764 RepID=UPI003692617D